MNDRQYTTHPNVVTGVVLMASLALWSVLFWVAIFIIGRLAPPSWAGTNYSPVLADYLTTPRVVIAVIVAIIGTVAFWQVMGED